MQASKSAAKARQSTGTSVGPTDQAEATSNSQTGADGVEHVLGPSVDIKQVLGAEHGHREDAQARARPQPLLEAAKRQVVVFALVI